MLKKAMLMIAVAGLAIPVAMAQTTKAAPTGEENKISQPADTATKGKTAKPAKMTPEQEKKVQATGSEQRALPAPAKMTAEEKKADKKAKRTGVTPEEQEKQRKATPGG